MKRTFDIVFWIVSLCFVAVFTWGAALIVMGCGIPTAQHAANVEEGAQQALELTDCRAKGRAAKVDGGAQAYMEVYEQCASESDKKHGVK